MSTANPTPLRITRSVVYGHAVVGLGTDEPRRRALMMDVYEPTAIAPGTLLPALVLAFGGAFHRGSRTDDRVAEGGASNTSIADYCAHFASLGYCCFSIDYRLTQEMPDGGDTPVLDDTPVPTLRIDHVRSLLGLGTATQAMIRDGIEAATDDMAMAYRFVVGAARQWRVDPQRVAVGGFSAGGRIALAAALGEDITPAAVIALSAYAPDSVLDLFEARQLPACPMLLIRGERDLPYIIEQTSAMVSRLAGSGAPTAVGVVPGAGHFYPAQAIVTGLSPAPVVLQSAIEWFLEQAGLAPA